MGKLLSVSEAADLLNVSRWHIYRLVELRQIQFVRVGTTAIRFNPESLQEWLRSRTVEAVGVALA